MYMPHLKSHFALLYGVLVNSVWMGSLKNFPINNCIVEKKASNIPCVFHHLASLSNITMMLDIGLCGLLTLLIMLRVHSNTASKICGISLVMWPPSLLTMVAMVLRTSGSRAAGTLRW